MYPFERKSFDLTRWGFLVAAMLVFIGVFASSVSSQPATPIPLLKEKVDVKQPGKKVVLPGATWVPQSFNNCGPATVSMVLQYFGHTVSQEETRAHLRNSPDDSNVFTYEIKDYLESEYAISSKLLYNGDVETLKTLLANGVYIVIEDYLHPDDKIGHFTILKGYDDEKGVFISDDSYIGTDTEYPYEAFDQKQWKPFNREYLPVYTKDKEKVVKAIVGDDWEEKTMYAGAVATAQKEIKNDENDMYAWFNLGTSYFGLGEYDKAKQAFEKSQSLGWPKLMLWYQIQPVQTYNKLGEYDKALELAGQGLGSNDSFAELHLERATSYKGLGEAEKARAEAEKALFFDPELQKAKDFL